MSKKIISFCGLIALFIAVTAACNLPVSTASQPSEEDVALALTELYENIPVALDDAGALAIASSPTAVIVRYEPHTPVSEPESLDLTTTIDPALASETAAGLVTETAPAATLAPTATRSWLSQIFAPATAVNTPVFIPTNTQAVQNTLQPTATPTRTPTNQQKVVQVTFTYTPTNKPPAPTATFTSTRNPTATRTFLPTATRTFLPTATRTLAPTSTFTMAPTATNTNPPPPTATFTPVPTQAPSCGASGDSGIEGSLLNLINQARANAGLGALSGNGALQAAARAHSTDMACNSFFDHTGSDGSDSSTRVGRQGYSFSYLGETLYAGSGSNNSADRAIQAWLNSGGHRDIILSPNFTEVGVGYIFNPNSPYGGYYTAVFGKP